MSASNECLVRGCITGDHFVFLNEPEAFCERLLAFLHGDSDEDAGRSLRVRRNGDDAGLEEFVVASPRKFLPSPRKTSVAGPPVAAVLKAVAELRVDIQTSHATVLERLQALEAAQRD